MCSTVQRRGGGGGAEGATSRHGSLELTPGERETSDGTPPMTLDRHDEPTAMQRQRRRRGEPALQSSAGRQQRHRRTGEHAGHVGIGARGVGWACIMNGPDSDGGDVGETAARVATATMKLA